MEQKCDFKVNGVVEPIDILKMPNLHVERFQGQISLDCEKKCLIIRDNEGGCVEIKACQIPDLMSYIEKSKKLFK